MLMWKDNWEESRKNYLDWWNGKGLVMGMWEFIDKKGLAHEEMKKPVEATDLNQFWFDPVWRAEHIHYQLSKSSFQADILPITNTHLGPGSLAAILGADLDGGDDTIWIKHKDDFNDEIIFSEENKWWKLHVNLLNECRKKSQGRYFIGMPDLIEGLDTLAALRGPEATLMDMMMRPEVLEEQLQKVNDIYFEVFDRLYNIINVNGEMAFCYFSIWAPGKVAKLQSDISVMISEEDYIRFVQPFIREQAQKIDYSLYHLDGVDAIRHLDAVLDIKEINAIQWTPGFGEPQGGDKKWFDLYKKILKSGKSVMANWVELDELKPLLDHVGSRGMNIQMNFTNEDDIEKALKIIDNYR